MSCYVNDKRVTADPDGSYLVDSGAGPYRVTHAEPDGWEAFPTSNDSGFFLVAGSADEAIECLIGGPQ